MTVNWLLTRVEHAVSKLGHPNVFLSAANILIDGQNVTGYDSASIGRNCVLRGNIILGEDVLIPRDCELRIDVTIGKRSKIGTDCELIGDVTLGKYCAVARDVTLQQLNHPVDRPSMNRRFYDRTLNSRLDHVSDGPITVGNDVWIGTDVIVLSGVTIGDGAVVGAGSVVTDDVEPYAIVAGTPAERVRWRFPAAVRDRLLALGWWDWDDDRIHDNREFFHTRIESVADVDRVVDRN